MLLQIGLLLRLVHDFLQLNLIAECGEGKTLLCPLHYPALTCYGRALIHHGSVVCWKEHWLMLDLGAHCVPPLIFCDIEYITKPVYVPFSLL